MYRCAALVLALALARPVAAEPVLMANRSRVNVRADATVQSRRIAELRQGEEVAVVRRTRGWSQVRLADGRTGWVHQSLMQERLVVVGNGVRVRSGPSAAAEALTMVYRGQELGKLETRGDWVEVLLPQGGTGWIAGRFARPKEVQAPPAAPVAPAPAAAPEEVEEEKDHKEAGAPQRNPYAEGLQLEARGEYRTALQRFEEVLRREPGQINALVHAAQAHKQLDEYGEALDKLYRALGKSGPRRDIFLVLGEVYRLRAQPDSAAKYRALFRGEEWKSEPQPQKGAEPAAPGMRLPWRYGLVLAGGVLAALLVLVRRRRGRGGKKATSPGGAEPEPKGRFARLVQESRPQSRPAASPGEEAALDREIEDKWRQLRQSAEVFAPLDSGAEQGLEAEQLSQLLQHVESLRKALEMQDERARLYAEIARLQTMRIEAMSAELKLLRGQGRKN